MQDSLTRCSRLKPGTPDDKIGQHRASLARQKAGLAALVHPEVPEELPQRPGKGLGDRAAQSCALRHPHRRPQSLRSIQTPAPHPPDLQTLPRAGSEHWHIYEAPPVILTR